jgi:hypothetical protein
MHISKKAIAYFAMASLAAVAVYGVFYNSSGAVPTYSVVGATDTQKGGRVDPATLTVIEIGSNAASDKALEKLSSLGAKSSSAASVPSSATAVNAKTVLILANDWLAQNSDDTAVQGFLKKAAQNKATFVSLGGNTNELFVALDKAGVSKMASSPEGEVRNPAQNAPAVAFAIKDDPQGTGTYEAISVSQTTGAADQIDELLSWMNR